MTLNIELENPDKRVALFGPGDRNLRTLREVLNVGISGRDRELRITGERESIDRAVAALKHLQGKLRRQDYLDPDDLAEAVRVAGQQQERREGELEVFVRGRAVAARTEGQRRYIDGMLAHDLTFCTGPAGTGKTYLAVAVAASLLKQGKIKRIVLARPAVEAGERLGFLPGDLQAKVNPYLRPLFDSLHDMMDFEQVRRLMATDVIEVIPLAFMRGRTLNDSCVILDEAQNATVSQTLMFLTRLGERSKMIVTGDASQVDLPDGTESGLADALRRLGAVPGVFACRLGKSDIVRHRLVQDIVQAYADVEEARVQQNPRPQQPRRGVTADAAGGPPSPEIG